MLVVLVCATLGWAKDLDIEDRLDAALDDRRRAEAACERCGCLTEDDWGSRADKGYKHLGKASCCGSGVPHADYTAGSTTVAKAGSWAKNGGLCGNPAVRGTTNAEGYEVIHPWKDGRLHSTCTDFQSRCDDGPIHVYPYTS